MRAFSPADLARFLGEIDRLLPDRTVVVVIGGAAAALHYGVERGTVDIDTWTTVDRTLARAAEQARDRTALPIPLGKSGVADGPHDFESRLQRALPRLRRLVVQVPERHDLALMKVVRGEEHDLEAIEALQPPLDLDTLVSRYEAEMDAVIIDPRRLRANVLALVERLFPDRVAGVALRLRRHRR